MTTDKKEWSATMNKQDLEWSGSGIILTKGLMSIEVDRRIFKLDLSFPDQLIGELASTKTLQYESNVRTVYLYKAPMKEDVAHLRPFVKRGMVGRCYEESAYTFQTIGSDWVCSIDGPILPSPRSVLDLFYRPPSIAQQALSLASAFKQAASEGTLATRVSPETFALRKEICLGCEYYDPAAFLGTGRCRVCGCGVAKLHMPSQSCPKDKWGKENQ
jgi:hypothetical protein